MRIETKIRVISVVAWLAISLFFIFLYLQEREEHIKQSQKRYLQTSYLAHMSYDNDYMTNDMRIDAFLEANSFGEFLKSNNMRLMDDEKEIQDILINAKPLETISLQSGDILNIFKTKAQIYILIENSQYWMMIADYNKDNYIYKIALMYLSSLVILFLLYWWLTKSLLPLKSLEQKIVAVGQGDLSVNFKSRSKDEVAHVSNAFDDSLRKIEALVNSRQLFLRSIMHELKTPIAKGKLLNEFLVDEEQKKRYDGVFERLALLLDEFSKIEQMLSSNYKLTLSRFNIIDIIDNSMEIAYLDAKDIEIINHEECMVNSDFTLLSLAIKNLLDNAVSYSSDKKAHIDIYKNSIAISSKEERFTDDIESYFVPFHGKGHGFGLGLYIIKNIMDMLHFKLEYRYDDANIFVISFE